MSWSVEIATSEYTGTGRREQQQTVECRVIINQTWLHSQSIEGAIPFTFNKAVQEGEEVIDKQGTSSALG